MGLASLYFAATIAGLCQVYIGYDSQTYSSIIIFDSWNAWWTGCGWDAVTDGIQKGMAMPPECKVNNAVLGLLNTAYNVPTILVAFFLSPMIQDKFGRRLPMSLGSAIIVVSAIIMSQAPSVGVFWFGRILMGAGQGLVYAAPTYMSEIATYKIRGRVVGIWQITWACGALVASLVALGAQNNPYLDNWQWRVVVLMQIVIPSFVAFSIWFLPESPRWLVSHDKVEQAKKALTRFRAAGDDIDKEHHEIVEAVRWEKENTSKIGFLDLFKDRTLAKRLAIACCLNLFNQICGNNAMNNFGTLVYTAAFNSPSIALIMACIQDIVQIIGAMIAILWIDKLGRRFALFWGAIWMGSMLLVAASIPVGIGEQNIGHNLPAAIFTTIAIFLFYLGFGPSWGASVWIWTVEVFPLNIRAQMVGIASQFQNIGSLVFGTAFPSMYGNLSYKALYIFVAINVIMAIGTWFFVKETKGVPLEQMDEIFGGVNRVKDQEAKDAALGQKGYAADEAAIAAPITDEKQAV